NINKIKDNGLDAIILINQMIDIFKELLEYEITNDMRFFEYLEVHDLEKINDHNKSDIINLVNVFTSVFEKTNRTNITYQFLMAVLLERSTSTTSLISEVNVKEEQTVSVKKSEENNFIVETKIEDKVSEAKNDEVLVQENLAPKECGANIKKKNME